MTAAVLGKVISVPLHYYSLASGRCVSWCDSVCGLGFSKMNGACDSSNANHTLSFPFCGTCK